MSQNNQQLIDKNKKMEQRWHKIMERFEKIFSIKKQCHYMKNRRKKTIRIGKKTISYHQIQLDDSFLFWKEIDYDMEKKHAWFDYFKWHIIVHMYNNIRKYFRLICHLKILNDTKWKNAFYCLDYMEILHLVSNKWTIDFYYKLQKKINKIDEIWRIQKRIG